MRKFIGIDIGGTSIKYAVIEENLKIIEKSSIRTRKTREENYILEDVKSIIRELLERYDIEKIGISTAGVVDVKKGKITYAGETIPGYMGTELKKELEGAFKKEVSVENDVNSAAIGEVKCGAGKDSTSTFMLTIGTGIGGALLLEDKVFYGYGGSAGEVGYIRVRNEKVQDIASTTALVKNVNLRLGENLNGIEIFNLAERGNKVCIEEIDNILKIISELVSTIVYTINPETIVLGGGIMERRDYVDKRLQKYTKDILGEEFYKKTTIRLAKLGNNAGIIGAVSKFI